MDQSEIDTFLSTSKTPLRLGTTNSKGEPNIHPVWYHYVTNKLYLMSYKDAVKVRNLKHSKTVYFSVDTDALPNRGVKGMAKNMIDEVRKGSEVLVEITPHYFSTWDYTKSKF